MTETQIVVEKTLRRLGLNGTQKGFWCAVWSIFLVLEDPTVLCGVTTRLYPRVGELCGMNKGSVARDLRELAENCWYCGDREFLCEVAGRKLVTRPSVGEFLDFISAYLRYQGY